MLILSILRGVGQLIFGKPDNTNTQQNKKSYYNAKSRTGYREEKDSKKIFAKDEGEYIKYEEITD